MTEYSYQVIYKPELGVGSTDITNWVDRIDAIDIGSGEIRSSKIRFNAMNGRFVTFTDSGATPLIDEFDKIRLTITDRNGDQYDAIYEVDNIKPIQNSQVGTLIEVESFGMEWNTQKTPMAKPFFEESGFQVGKGVMDIYNDPNVKGTDSPSVIDHDDTFAGGGFNELPKYTANVYPFDLREQSCYGAEIITMDKMGGTIGAGGAGNFFEIGFEDDMTDVNFNTLKFRGFISGSPPDQSSVPTIDDSLAVNPGEEEGGLQSTMGFVQGTWGPDGIGTMPYQNSLFAGALELWNQYPEYLAGVTYPTGAIIEDRVSALRSQDDFYHYKTNKATAIAPPTPPTASNADWDLHTFVDFLATEVGISGQYSKWTNAKASEWKSCGAKTDGSVQDDPPLTTSVSVWDQNLVVVDGSYSRTWVDAKAVDPSAINTNLLYGGTSFYRGFRVLVAGTGTGAFAGFDNQIIQFTVSGVWRTFRNPSNDALCAVDNESKVYQKQSGLWVDVSATREGNDCYHPIYDIGNDQGFMNKDNGAGSNYGLVSGVTTEFRYAVSDVTTLTAPQYYRMGAWINWRTPFPPNSFSSNTIGSEYGDATTKEPATLDAGNMHRSSDGKLGFNHTSAQDLGPLSSLRVKNKFLWKYNKDGSGAAVRAGNFKCAAYCYDSSDNVVMQEFVIPFNGDFTQTVDLPLNKFTIYRGRKPWTYEDLASNVFLQQLEILNRFEWKNLQKVCLVWLGPYDDSGRYQPWGQLGFLFPALENIFTGLFVDGYNIKWEIDSWEFAKPGLALTTPIPSARATMLPFDDQPQILNTFQLTQHNQAQLELTQFRRVRYDVVTEGTCKEKFGDSIFLENDTLVREANRNESAPGANDGDPNTIKLVCKKIRYEITKPSNGPGGFLRYIDGVKRFV